MSETPELLPSVQRARKNRYAIVVAAAAGAGGALAAAVSPRLAPPPPVVFAAPAPVTVPVMLPVPVVLTVAVDRQAPRAPEPCPRRYLTATDVEPALLPEPVDAVAVASHDVRLLAAWNGDHVFVSTDEGRTFRRVLDGVGIVGDAAFDCHGRLHVVRGAGRLGVLDDGAVPAERWIDAAHLRDPGGPLDVERPRLAVLGADVALLGIDPARDTRLLIARVDRRGRWRTEPLFEDRSYEYWTGVEIEQIDATRSGRVHALVRTWESDMCGHQRYHRIGLARGDGSARNLGEDAPAQPQPPADAAMTAAVRDTAGRWVGLPADADAGAGTRQLRRTGPTR